MPITTQNWDGVTPPAIPAGWNVDANFSTAGFGAAISSPNVLQLASGATANTPFYATYGTADGSGGNVVSSAYIQWAGHADWWGLTARGSASTLNNSSTSQYVCWFKINPAYPALGGSVRISKVVSGTETPINSLTLTAANAPASGAWHQMTFSLNGTTLQCQITRNSDGFYLQPGGTWSATVATCLTTTDSSLSGSGFCGLVAQQGQTSESLLTDNFNLTAQPAPVPLPSVLIVRVPFQYYPINSE